jgi:hypothetical protein
VHKHKQDQPLLQFMQKAGLYTLCFLARSQVAVSMCRNSLLAIAVANSNIYSYILSNIVVRMPTVSSKRSPDDLTKEAHC